MGIDESESIGLSAVACYVPEGRLTVEEIASRSGVPIAGITDRYAMKAKPVAAKDEQPSDMGLRAARAALEKAQVDPKEVSAVIVAGGGMWDYPAWPISAKIQDELGLEHAFAFEVVNGCLAGVLGIHVAQKLLVANPSATTALVVMCDKPSAFEDHTNPRSLAWWHFSDGAAAAVVRKREPRNRILSYRARTIGRLHSHVRLNQGGTVAPLLPGAVPSEHGVFMHDILQYNKELLALYGPVYKEVIDGALGASGRNLSDVRLISIAQQNRALTGALLAELGAARERVYSTIEQFGHMGACDPLLALEQSEQQGLLQRGDILILSSATAGFTWGAMVVEH
jgi:3-oxoacyl-[acyl-carrier-protein] synthase-3